MTRTTPAPLVSAEEADAEAPLVWCEPAMMRKMSVDVGESDSETESESEEAIDVERTERHNEYGTLLQSIEQVIAGKAELI